ncbi:hypothetical protein [Oceanospirillum sp.]|uniref:hypothetical protein n=1 Tax=Oceanospirillum sp. TaxID=2021254 RepID=UPI003A8E9C37
MSEFRNRIDSQREAIKIVNSFQLYDEFLFSLTEKSINRWVAANQIDPKARHVGLLVEVSSKLSFLANKSQEQITEDYIELSKSVSKILDQLFDELNKIKNNN